MEQEQKGENYVPRTEYFIINGLLLLFFFSWRIFVATGALTSFVFWYSIFSAIGFFYFFLRPSEGNQALDPLWFNFDKTMYCKPLVYRRPTSEDEIIQFVKECKQNQRKLKVVGKGHSMGSLTFTTGEMILLDNFNKVLNLSESFVTVQAGMTLSNLHQFLWEKGYSLPFAPFLPDQTVVGAIQTGAHSSSGSKKCFASLVSEVTAVDGNGEKKTYNLSKLEDAKVTKALLIGLGCTGIITSITLCIEKAFYFHYVDSPGDLSEEVAKLEQSIAENEQFVLRWIPGTSICRKLILNKRDSGAIPFYKVFLDRLKIEIPKRIASFILTLVAFIPRLYSPAVKNLDKILLPVNTFVPSYQGFSNFHYARNSEVEFSIPQEKLAECMKELQAYLNSKKWNINSFALIQVVDQDDFYLSPFFNRKSCTVSLSLVQSTLNLKKSFIDGLVAFFKNYEGRPIWSKYHNLKHSDLTNLYRDLNSFSDVRSQMDGDGLFLNDYLQRLLLS